MEDSQSAPTRLQLIRRDVPPVTAARGAACEAMLSMLNGKIQVLIDHVAQLEDRVHHMEAGIATEDGGSSEQTIVAGAVKIDHAARRVFVSGREIPLSPTEYRLIYQLASNSGKVVLHRDLLRRASLHGEVNPTNLKVYIGRLRAKLNTGGGQCDLRAVRGVGYRLSA